MKVGVVIDVDVPRDIFEAMQRSGFSFKKEGSRFALHVGTKSVSSTKVKVKFNEVDTGKENGNVKVRSS